MLQPKKQTPAQQQRQVTNQRRQQLYRLLQVGKRELHMSDEAYRDLLTQHRAKPKKGQTEPSASTLSIAGLELVLGAMKAQGFVVKPKRKTSKSAILPAAPNWRQPRLEKIWRLWAELANSQHPQSVQNGSDQALLEFCQRQTKIMHPDWLTTYQLNQLVESLKKWCKRCDVDINYITTSALPNVPQGDRNDRRICT